VRANLAELDRQLAGDAMIRRLLVVGGWYAILRIAAVQADEVTARHLLDRGVWVHPGHFFGMPPAGWLVLSLLTPEPDFRTGVTILLNYLGTNQTCNNLQ
jgi:hypothetical protein